ncbi:uncharacterized protein K444DRAFT_24532 [Hyaloscypha bicolor E]|uniref:Uncharacterized protein n=1 Tax=Hyaloscypha bicolor E TaxID=1095630 RepID=A0A2J6T440_9HELO|nr:uncharacterized protein K444DRAFT_24532 [Hyaloscypha bicolor E]PMD57794.1 hypothetical protein K444DRAFT_24532 [Hyaloscypha bicolor E]
MIRHSTMLQRTRDSGSFSEAPTKESSFLARLKPIKAPAPVPRWPDSQDSVGKHCCKVGEQNFWEVKDPGREKLVTLKLEVRLLLNTHNEHLKEREACNVYFAIFMVGREETACCPTLVIISSNKSARQKVIEVIRSNGILDKYEGVLLAGSSKHPRYPRSAPAEFIAFGLEIDASRSFPSGVAVYIQKSITKITSGTWIYIPIGTTTMDVSQFRRATIGGFLDLITEDDVRTTVGMTVAHAFQEQDRGSMPNQSEVSEDDDDFEFEFDGPTPDNIFGKGSSADYSSKSSTRSRFPFSFPSARKRIVEVGQTINPTESTSSLRPFNETQFVLEKGSELTKLGILLKSSLETRPDLDWALIEITAKELTISNAINLKQKRSMQSIIPTRQFSTIETDIAVATCIGSKHATVGVMSGSSTFLKMVHSDTFEEVKTVALSGYLCSLWRFGVLDC